jgi:hypothetical protein
MPLQRDHQRQFLWIVTDPRGLTIACAKDVWDEHVAYRPELTEHFAEVKLTAQEPDEIYLDPVSTRRRAPGRKVYWYYRKSLTKGLFANNLIAVIVKVVLEPDGVRRGYVQSALIPNEKEKRLTLEWARST